MGIQSLLHSFASWLGTSARAVLDGFNAPRKKGLGERFFARSAGPGGTTGYAGGLFADRWTQVQAYRHWTMIAIRAIAKEIAFVPPNIAIVRPAKAPMGKGTPNDQWRRKRWLATNKNIQPHEEVDHVGEDHPLRQLFAKPNAVDMASDLFFQLVMFLELTGEAYMWVIPSQYGRLSGRGEAAELWIIPSHWVWPRIRGRDATKDECAQGLVEDYEIRPLIGTGPWHIPACEIIPFRWPSPLHMLRGWSPTQAGSEWIDGTANFLKIAYWTAQNGAYPSGVIKAGPSYIDQDDALLRRTAEKFYTRYQTPPKAGVPIFLPPDMDWVPMVLGGQEFPFVQSAEAFRDNTLALHDVNKSMIGLEPSGDSISWYASQKGHFRNCIGPRASYIFQVLTRHLASRWDPQLRVWQDDHTPEDPQQVNLDMAADNAAYVTTINERRAIRGLPPKPGMDWIPSAMGIGELSADSGESPYDLDSLSKPDGEEKTPEDEAQDKPAIGKANGSQVPAWVSRMRQPLPLRKDLQADFPTVLQPDDHGCGSSCLRGVGELFGVGPDTEEEWQSLLGTTEEDGTPWDNLIKVGRKLGLEVQAGPMTLDSLAEATGAGKPVICCHATKPWENQSHYSVVLAVTDTSVIVQDPAEGRKRVGKNLWLSRWEDATKEGAEAFQGIVFSSVGAEKRNGVSHAGHA